MQTQPPIAHTKEHQQLQQQQIQYNQQQKSQSKLPNRQLEAAKSMTNPLFSTNQVALLRMSNQLDNLVQTTQALQSRGIQSRPRSTSPLACREPPAKTNFRQRLFNSIFVEKFKRAFTVNLSILAENVP